MPKIWMDAIAGHGEVDLRGTEILTAHQLMFTTGGFFNRMAGAVATRALRSDVGVVERPAWPEVFRAREFSGTIYRLEEPVLAARSILTALVRKFPESACRATVTGVSGNAASNYELTVAAETGEPLRLRARAMIFTAGAGNEQFAGKLGLEPAKVAQRRPLRMFMARGLAHPLYAHCLVPEPKPRVTVTSHVLDGENVWYLGGNIAEKAVGMSDAEAFRWAHAEMTDLFPWLNWRDVRWAIHDVDRAEPHASKLLPSGPTLITIANAALAWPTKLALAPALTQQALRWLEQRQVTPSGHTTPLPLPRAVAARYPWEEVREWMQL